MKHPIRVEGYDGSLEELAKAVGKMRYDKVAEFLQHLGEDFARQGDDDLTLRGRPQLAEKLYAVSQHLLEGKLSVDEAMKKCARHMSEEELEGYNHER